MASKEAILGGVGITLVGLVAGGFLIHERIDQESIDATARALADAQTATALFTPSATEMSPTFTLTPETPTVTPIPSETPTLTPSEKPSVTPSMTPTPTPFDATGTAVYSGLSTSVVEDRQAGLNPNLNIDPRLAGVNQLKEADANTDTWNQILNTLDTLAPKDNVFGAGLRTLPTDPYQVGEASTNPEHNMRLGHTGQEKHLVVADILTKAETMKGSELLTLTTQPIPLSGGRVAVLAKGEIIGSLSGSSAMAALAELVAEDQTQTWGDRTIAELLGDQSVVGMIAKRQNLILQRRIKYFTKNTIDAGLTDAERAKLPSSLIKSDFAACEQYVAVYNPNHGLRGETSVVYSRLVVNARGDEKTFTTADTAQEVFFIPTTTMTITDPQGNVLRVSREAIATDRDFAWIAGLYGNSDLLNTVQFIEGDWASEDYLVPCATGEAAVATAPTLIPDFQPDFTPGVPTLTPSGHITPTQHPESTPTLVATNVPPKTRTPISSTARPTDITYPTVVPTAVIEATKPAILPTAIIQPTAKLQ